MAGWRYGEPARSPAGEMRACSGLEFIEGIRESDTGKQRRGLQALRTHLGYPERFLWCGSRWRNPCDRQNL